MTDLTGGQTAGRARALRERGREPEALAHAALLDLDPIRAGMDLRLQGKDYLMPNIAASAADRMAHTARFNPDALKLFGPDALEATARIKDADGVCRWCWSWATARRGDRPTPHLRVGARQPGERTPVRRAFEALLGPACSDCEMKLAAEAKRADTARLKQRQRRTQRAPAASSAVTAAALAGKSQAELRTIMNTLNVRVHASRVRSARRIYAKMSPQQASWR
ncbi:hypothetical protein [Kribbella soli]|uniref:Uncharacterized protein n=1 Tax=Kribbella soli TaxID=1124743 RepID=A0A4R0GZM0_9ACTN|nr:hypothetical protein [Kribbella soli]TCC01332.1 hypothetical protein E0H45_42185 [Kribbella soli]